MSNFYIRCRFSFKILSIRSFEISWHWHRLSGNRNWLQLLFNFKLFKMELICGVETHRGPWPYDLLLFDDFYIFKGCRWRSSPFVHILILCLPACRITCFSLSKDPGTDVLTTCALRAKAPSIEVVLLRDWWAVIAIKYTLDFLYHVNDRVLSPSLWWRSFLFYWSL